MLGFLDEAARRALEAEMNPEKYEFRSEFMRRIVAEGEARGELVALASAVLKVLEARGLAVDDDERALVLDCRDRAQLEDWLVRAVHVADVDELLASR